MNETADTVDSRRPKWTQVSWRRVFIALTLVFLICFAVNEFVALLYPWYSTRKLIRNNPQLAVTPTALRDMSRSQLTPDPIECFGFSLQTPWALRDRTDFRSATIIRFKSGVNIMAMDPASTPNMSAQLRKQGKTMEQFFGSRTLASQYDWMTAELSATSAQTHWWDWRIDQRTGILLGDKLGDAFGASTIFKIDNGKVRGYQFGDPASAPEQIKIELFDITDHRYQILILLNHQQVRQADLNSIISSFRPVLHN